MVREQQVTEEVCPDCEGRKYNLYDNDDRFVKDKCMTCDGRGHVAIDEYGNVLTPMPLPVAATPIPIEIPSSEEEEIPF